MTVIPFPPRSVRTEVAGAGRHHAVTGTFRSPRGRSGVMKGVLRVAELHSVPTGVHLTGVFTAALQESDGTLIGHDSTRRTLVTQLVRREGGRELVIGPLDLDLMGLTVHVEQFTIGSPGPLTPADGPLVQNSGPRGRRGGGTS